MTTKEAILKVLQELWEGLTVIQIYDRIIENKYCEFKKAKTPMNTINRDCGDFIRNGDSRVKRIKKMAPLFTMPANIILKMQ